MAARPLIMPVRGSVKSGTTRSRAKKARGPLKGRTLTAIGLLAFLFVAVAVISRRSAGTTAARAMRKMEVQKGELRAQQVTLERDLEEATSLRRVVSEAQRRLSLHVATDAQTRVLSDSTLP